MTDELIERAGAVVGKVDGRNIDIRLVSWGEVTTRTAEGIKESFARGAFEGTDASRVTLEAQRHGGSLVGVAESIEERDDGAYGSFRVATTPAGDELLTLAREGILRAASVVFRPIKHRDLPGGIVERQAVELARVAVLDRGAYPSAQVMAVRAEQEVPPVVSESVIREAVDLTPYATRDEVESAIARVEASMSVPKSTKGIPAQSLGEYAKMVFRGELDDDLLMRTWADQITSQNDGVNQSGWITDVKRIVQASRPAISAFGGPIPLPETGMNVVYPFQTSANTLVAVQATQKTEIQSARVDIDDQSTAIATYAGGSDISIQLIERSTPSYLEAYQRIMTAYWARVTNAAFVTALEAGSVTQVMGSSLGAPVALSTSAHADDIIDTATAHGFSVGDPIVFTSLTGGDATTAALVNRVVWVTGTSFGAQTFRPALTPGGAPITYGTADLSAGSVASLDSTATGLRASLFQASLAVQTATGAPANVVLVGADVFTALGGLTDVVPPAFTGTASGTAAASTLNINISGLNIVYDPNVTAGKIIVSNSQAAKWAEDGPRWLTATNAQLLGQDHSIYSFGAPLVFVPAAVIEVTFA